ncbi:MAG TPA: MFS transporter, partial [Candidatus Acidoferrales bacterium]|nr:MFS transporter [Candidatus Acidoferrales bacterium]
LGPSVGGLVIATVGIAGCFFLNAMSFLALIFTLILMELPAWDGSARRVGLWKEINEGYQYLRSNSQMFAIVMLSYVVATVGAPYATFVPVFATNVLHVGPLGFGLLMSAPGVGAIAAGLWLASLGNLQPNPFWVCALTLGYGLFLALFAFSNIFILSLIFLVSVGFCFIAFRASINTSLQSHTPPHLLGRVLSFFFMDRGLWSIGGLMLGSAASMIGIKSTVEIAAAICAGAASIVLFIFGKTRVRHA